MDNTPTRQYILKRLSAFAERDDIIREVCLRDGLRWSECEALVEEVQEDNSPAILRRKSPILIIILLGNSLLGLICIIYAIWELFEPALVQGRFTWAMVPHILNTGQAYGGLLLVGMAGLLSGLTGLVGLLYHLIRNEGSWEED